MAKPESWQVSTEAAEVYESCFVPAIFGAWADPVADAAGIEVGNRVLDVACGTGVLAREALRRVGQKGLVVGLDLNEGMLAVAARTDPKVCPVVRSPSSPFKPLVLFRICPSIPLPVQDGDAWPIPEGSGRLS